jgi:hypothetical protein
MLAGGPIRDPSATPGHGLRREPEPRAPAEDADVCR